MIDAENRRDAALKKHVPEVVLLLLFAVFVVDLDRPRRGLIRVNQDTMMDLSAATNSEASLLEGAAQRRSGGR